MSTARAQLNLDGESVTIRPLGVADRELERNFIRGLSAETRYFRFLCGVKELPAAELKRLCTVDGSHSMAFVALVNIDGTETEIGVCRYAESNQLQARELAITIADAWAHKGLAQQLLRHLIAYAKSHGVKQLYSVELADNVAMCDIATEFGMSKKVDPSDASQVIYSLSL